MEEMGSVLETLGLDISEIIIIGLGITFVWMVDRLCSKKQVHFPFLVQQRGNAVRYIVFYLLLIAIFVFGIYGSGYHAEQFIYMQF